MPWQLLVALGLNLLMQTFQSAAYAACIAGVRTGQIAIAISLFSLVVTASRTVNMFYAPMIGTLSDVASKSIQAHVPDAARAFEWQMRLVLFASTAGATVGALLIPLFAAIYTRGIRAFNRTDSLIRASARLLDPIVIASLARGTRLPPIGVVIDFSIAGIPTTLLFANLLLTAVYAVGVVAATYASVINPGRRCFSRPS